MTENQSETKSDKDRPNVTFDRRMLEALICPQTHTNLDYDADKQELVSKAAGVAFPIRNGIPIMLLSEARSLSD